MSGNCATGMRSSASAPAMRDDDGDDDGQPRPVDENAGDHGGSARPAGGGWRPARRLLPGGGAPTGAAFTCCPGRTRCSPSAITVSPPCRPGLDHHLVAHGAGRACTGRRCAFFSASDDDHVVAALVLQHRGAGQDDGRHRLGALDRDGDELAIDQLAVAGCAGLHLGAARVRDQRADQQGVGVAVDLGVDELDPPALRIEPAIGGAGCGSPRHRRRRAARSGCAIRPPARALTVKTTRIGSWLTMVASGSVRVGVTTLPGV